MANIVVTQRIPDPGIPILSRLAGPPALLSEEGSPTRERLLEAVAGCRALVTLLTDPVDAELLDAAGEDLRIVANYAVGFDNIDVAAASDRGILVANTPDVLTDATAELAIALILAAARNVLGGDRLVRAGEWRGWSPTLMLGTQVTGKTLGIVGAGRIGLATARMARGLKMELIYSNRKRRESFEESTGATYVSFHELLERADFVSLHVPLRPETVHLVGRPELARMKPGAILVNTSRGPLVDEAALVEALETGSIAGAALDVYEDEPALAPGLSKMDNTVLLPHLGSATIETRSEMARLAATAVADVLAGRQPPNLVNAQVWDRRRGR